MRVAFYDCCRTIVKINTLNAFFDFLEGNYLKLSFNEKSKKYFMKYLWDKGVLNSFQYKIYKFSLIRGFNKNEIEKISVEFYDKVLKFNLNNQVICSINNDIKNGYKIVIVSGGLKVYLDYLGKQIGADCVAATELDFENQICNGQLYSVDCIGRGKLIKIRELEFYDEIDFLESKFYTDSYTDLPLLEKVGCPIAVNPDKWLREVCNVRNWSIIENG